MSLSKYAKQNYTHFIVLDYEATCIKDMRLNPQEIIEFPTILVRIDSDIGEWNVIDTFHEYVKPVFRPKLSPFCIKLTGILEFGK